MFGGVCSELASLKHRKRWRAHPPAGPPSKRLILHAPCRQQPLCGGSAAMAEECKEAASGYGADAPPLAAAAPPGDVEMSDCPAAAADPGQSARQHRVWTPRDTSETHHPMLLCL